jgi:hypothetical protein
MLGTVPAPCSLLANESGKPNTHLEGGDVSSILENFAGGESLPDLQHVIVRKPTKMQCCKSGCVGSICFWASWIRIRIR